jgi:hypothetical protein
MCSGLRHTTEYTCSPCPAHHEVRRLCDQTEHFMSQISALVDPPAAVAEPGTSALLVVWGMVSLVWHIGEDLRNSAEFALRKDQIVIRVEIVIYMIDMVDRKWTGSARSNREQIETVGKNQTAQRVTDNDRRDS